MFSYGSNVNIQSLSNSDPDTLTSPLTFPTHSGLMDKLPAPAASYQEQKQQ
jgi:hypothetical protein